MATIPSTPLPSRSWYRHWWGKTIITGLIGLLLLGLAFGWYIWQLSGRLRGGAAATTGAVLAQQLRTPGPLTDAAGTGRPSLGNTNAPLTIIEFLDFNCPVCKASYPTVREMTNRFGDRINFIVRHYPVIAETSPYLALASECAHEQGKFWNLHDRLHQSDDPNGQLSALARQAGLNMTQFDRCVDEERYMPQVQADLEAARAIGARGTPTFVINGHKVDGGIPRDIFLGAVEELVNP